MVDSIAVVVITATALGGIVLADTAIRRRRRARIIKARLTGVPLKPRPSFGLSGSLGRLQSLSGRSPL